MVDFNEIERLVKTFIEEKTKEDDLKWGNGPAQKNRLTREQALEIMMMCLRLYHEQQDGANTPD